MANSRSLSLSDSEAVGSSMTISRALRTSARQMLISQFSAVDRPLTLALSGAVTPTRSAIGATSRAMARQSTMPKRVALGNAEHDVLQDGHAGDEGQLLVDEVHPEIGRLVRRLDRHRPAVDLDDAGIAVDEAGEDLDQRRLAGAVGADQPVHLARQDVERDALQRLRAAEALGDVPGRDEAGERWASPLPAIQAFRCRQHD